MKSSEIDVAESAPTTPGVTRRDFVAGSVGLGTLSAVSAIAPQAAAAGAPATVVLVNEPYLRKRYPHDAASLLDSVGRFARQQNGEIVRLDGNETAAAIKARLQRLSRRPKRLVIFGDEGGIPRFAVKAPGVDIQVDWFYGDLDGDGLAEVAISRVLGGPRAMANQLGVPPGESYRGRLITYRGPRGVVGEVRQVGVDAWIENNHEGSGRFQAVSETDSEIVLQKRDNNIQFKLDLAARKTFWRRSNEEAWRHNYDIVEIMRTDDRSPTAAPYERIVYRRPEGPKTYFGVVRRLGSGQWIEINNDGSNRYQTVSETASEIVLHNRSNDIQFKLDLVARKCFWRRGTRENWKPNYDIIEMETNGAAGRAAASGALPVLAFTSGPQVHLEGNALATVIGDFSGRFENRDWPDLQLLARAGAVYFCGHGNPDGWYGGITGTIVTAPSVPELPGRPIVFAATCSTASPGAAIARTFMDRGCRVFIGAVSDSYGYTPAANGNQLLMHFIDALRASPDGSVAELVAQARNRYVRANGLAALMLQLEKGGGSQVDQVAAHTALQWMVIGDVTATHPRSQPSTVFSKLPFGPNHMALSPGASISRRFNIGPTDGLPTLFFRGQWDKDVSASLQIDILQNGELMHQLDWREQREFWAFTEGQAGGHWEGSAYHGFALLPLMRRADANDVTLRVTRASKPIQLRLESAVQIWPKRHPPQLPAPRLARTDRSNLLWLCRNDDTGPMRQALGNIPRLNYLEQRDFGDRLAVFEFPDEPQHLLDLANFDAILIDDVNSGYRAFPRGMGAKVRDFVRAGGGLVMAGGTDSFNGRFAFISQGGYGGTPIEDVLPVRIISPDDRVEGKTTVGPIDAGHPIAAGLAGTSFPAIFGYNRVAAKPGSTVLLRTASGDPLLVVGQYGRGRVAAFMTRSNRDWGAEFKTWPHYDRFWANLIRWVSPLDGSIYEYAP